MVEIHSVARQNYLEALEDRGRLDPRKFRNKTYLNMGRVSPVLEQLKLDPALDNQTVLIKNATTKKPDARKTEIVVLSGPLELDDLLSAQFDVPGLPKSGTTFAIRDASLSPTIIPIAGVDSLFIAKKIAVSELEKLKIDTKSIFPVRISPDEYNTLVKFLIDNDFYVPRRAIRYAGLREYERQVREEKRLLGIVNQGTS